MLSWFTEDATLPFISGIVLAVIFLFLFLKSREKTMLYVAAVIALLAGGIFACEQMIVTDREAIVAIVSDLASQVKNNHVPGVVKHISPKHQATIDRARAEMPRTSSVSATFQASPISKMPQRTRTPRKFPSLPISEPPSGHTKK